MLFCPPKVRIFLSKKTSIFRWLVDKSKNKKALRSSPTQSCFVSLSPEKKKFLLLFFSASKQITGKNFCGCKLPLKNLRSRSCPGKPLFWFFFTMALSDTKLWGIFLFSTIFNFGFLRFTQKKEPKEV